jgi:hypothetical protein
LLLWIQATGSLNRWLIALGGVAIGGVIYLIGVVILKVPEIKMLTGVVARRLKK